MGNYFFDKNLIKFFEKNLRDLISTGEGNKVKRSNLA